MKKYRLYVGLALVLPLLLASCDKYLDIVPVGDVIPQSETEYRATLNSAYAASPSQMLINLRGIVYDHKEDVFGLNLDAYDLYKTIHLWEDTNDNNGRSEQYPYYSLYKGIFYANSVILADPAAVADDDPDEDFDQILSEAYAIRAYNYFMLLNLYGPKWSAETAGAAVVPLNNTIDTEQTFPAVTLSDLYDQVLSDLAEAEKLSKVSRYENNRYRYRFSREAIFAFASRVYLYRGEWQKALDYAEKALAISKELADLGNLGEGNYLPTDYRSVEDIANFTNQLNGDISGYLSIQDDLYRSYAPGDLRAERYYVLSSQDWETDFYYIMDKVGTDSKKVTFRRAEVYLGAAEAAARLGNNSEAIGYLTALLEKRFTPEAFASEKALVSALSGRDLIDEILLQRRLELAGEGHDWFDFKRTTQPELKKVVRGETVILPAGDPRYVIILPSEARDNNPLL